MSRVGSTSDARARCPRRPCARAPAGDTNKSHAAPSAAAGPARRSGLPPGPARRRRARDRARSAVPRRVGRRSGRRSSADGATPARSTNAARRASAGMLPAAGRSSGRSTRVCLRLRGCRTKPSSRALRRRVERTGQDDTTIARPARPRRVQCSCTGARWSSSSGRSVGRHRAAGPRPAGRRARRTRARRPTDRSARAAGPPRARSATTPTPSGPAARGRARPRRSIDRPSHHASTVAAAVRSSVTTTSGSRARIVASTGRHGRVSCTPSHVGWRSRASRCAPPRRGARAGSRGAGASRRRGTVRSRGTRPPAGAETAGRPRSDAASSGPIGAVRIVHVRARIEQQPSRRTSTAPSRTRALDAGTNQHRAAHRRRPRAGVERVAGSSAIHSVCTR